MEMGVLDCSMIIKGVSEVRGSRMGVGVKVLRHEFWG